MLLTEEEAKAKWCPKASASDDQSTPVSVNRTRTNKPDGDCLCIGTACMAWRWGEFQPGSRHVKFLDNPETQLDRPPHRPEHVPATWTWVPFDPADGESVAHFREPDVDAAARRRGYCGAFGWPHQFA